MFSKVFGLFSHDIGVDLGTVNTLVYVKGRGIVINAPSVVAVNKKTGRIIAVGERARLMVGKTPSHIKVYRPLVEGVISEFEITEQMLRYFIGQARPEGIGMFARPKVVIGVPSGVTEVEKRAVEEAVKNAGAREARLIEEPMAAALGARLGVQDPKGNMVVDVGGGTTEIAIISLGGIVSKNAIRVAGMKMNDDIINYAREELNLLLGEVEAETVKIVCGSAFPLQEEITAYMRGRDLIKGLPKEVIVTDAHIRYALSSSVKSLVEAIKGSIESAPPDLVADIMDNGIILAGGGSLLRGLADIVSQETHMKVEVTDDPLTAVVRGCGIVIEDMASWGDVLVDIDND